MYFYGQKTRIGDGTRPKELRQTNQNDFSSDRVSAFLVQA